MVTEVSWFEYCSTMILVSSMPSLCSLSVDASGGLRVLLIPISYQLRKLGMAVASQEFYRIRRHGWRCVVVYYMLILF